MARVVLVTASQRRANQGRRHRCGCEAGLGESEEQEQGGDGADVRSDLVRDASWLARRSKCARGFVGFFYVHRGG